jgi:FixJ family two-component response regulator
MRACVSVIDDDALVLRSLDRLLQSRGFEVHTYSSPQAFLEQHEADTPGCIVMDLSMPGLSGLELQQALAHAADRRPVVFISGRSSVEASVRAMKAGAVDFLTKPFDEADLVAAVRAALERDRASREGLAERASINFRLATLTPRERDVLRGMAEGKNNAAIAEALFLTERSVEKVIHSIFLKLGLGWETAVHKRVKAVLLYLAEQGE